jgi:hypothetical protein
LRAFRRWFFRHGQFRQGFFGGNSTANSLRQKLVFCLGALALVSVVQVSAATFLHYRLYAANQALSAAAGSAGGVDWLIMAAVITTLITIAVECRDAVVGMDFCVERDC